MDKYYYLAATLPFLKFEERPPLTREDFLHEAQKWFTPGEFAMLSSIESDDFEIRENEEPTLREYRRFERALREEIASFREQGLAQKGYTPLRIIKSAVGDGTPLEIERRLCALRWQYAQDLEVGHYFDTVFLMLYFIKLQILERLYSFDKKKGTARFDALCEVNPVR